MSNPTLTGQDEARRALADSLQVTFECQGKNLAADIGILVIANLPAVLASLRASLDRGAEEMEDRLDRYEDALHDIQRWSEASPLSVFPEPDLKKARALLEAGGMTLDSISAYCMRHVVEGVGKIARRVLPVPADLNDGGADAPR